MFTLSRLEWLVIAAALLLCPGFSWSQNQSTASETSLFDRLDRNKDGYLSPQELAAPEARNGNWIAIDRNRDGRIARSEFRSEFNTAVAQPAPQTAPSAAAGGTRAPKQE